MSAPIGCGRHGNVAPCANEASVLRQSRACADAMAGKSGSADCAVASRMTRSSSAACCRHGAGTPALSRDGGHDPRASRATVCRHRREGGAATGRSMKRPPAVMRQAMTAREVSPIAGRNNRGECGGGQMDRTTRSPTNERGRHSRRAPGPGGVESSRRRIDPRRAHVCPFHAALRPPTIVA